MKRLVLALALAGGLAACETEPLTVVTDPLAYSVPGRTASPRSGESIAVVNGYDRQTMERIGKYWQTDYQQLTDTAVSVMTRHLKKSGVTVDPNAAKKVTLKVVNVQLVFMNIPFAERYKTSLDLEAAFGDGTGFSVHGENSAPTAMGFRQDVVPQRSEEGAAMFAVTDLLNDKRFLAYANR